MDFEKIVNSFETSLRIEKCMRGRRFSFPYEKDSPIVFMWNLASTLHAKRGSIQTYISNFLVVKLPRGGRNGTHYIYAYTLLSKGGFY